MTHTKESLIAFEKRVADAFLAKQIKAPIHLSGGNEDQLLAIFKDVRPGDWVFSTWRSHYHALLKGIPESWVWDEIMAGRSMYLMNREYRFFSSAIVGGILAPACGVAMGIKRRPAPLSNYDENPPERPKVIDKSKVWVFVGDMTARTGIYHEFFEYCVGHYLPVNIVIEDNGLSTNTPTEEAWGPRRTFTSVLGHGVNVQRYEYQRTYPHVGVGQHVQF